MLKHSHSFEAIGTQWHIETSEILSDELKSAIAKHIDDFDAVYSRFRPDSLVSRISANGAGDYVFPNSINEILGWYRKLYDATDHKVTPLIGKTLEDLGYDQSYSLQKKAFTPSPPWDEAMSLSNHTLNVSQPVVIDIGAAGKGYLVDSIAAILTDAQIVTFVIDASGDIYTSNTLQTIGLEHPFDTTKVLGAVTIDSGALCASASNRRQWGADLHHIVDPITAKPVRDIVATWVTAETTMQADGLATALFFVSPERLYAIADFSYAILFKDGSIHYSKDNEWEIYT